MFATFVGFSNDLPVQSKDMVRHERVGLDPFTFSLEGKRTSLLSHADLLYFCCFKPILYCLFLVLCFSWFFFSLSDLSCPQSLNCTFTRNRFSQADSQKTRCYCCYACLDSCNVKHISQNSFYQKLGQVSRRVQWYTTRS